MRKWTENELTAPAKFQLPPPYPPKPLWGVHAMTCRSLFIYRLDSVRLSSSCETQMIRANILLNDCLQVLLLILCKFKRIN